MGVLGPRGGGGVGPWSLKVELQQEGQELEG